MLHALCRHTSLDETLPAVGFLRVAGRADGAYIAEFDR